MRKYVSTAMLLAMLLPMAGASHVAANPASPQHSFTVKEANTAASDGSVNLDHGLALLTLPEDMKYASPEETNAVLQSTYNMAGTISTLGALMPAGINADSPAFWIAPINYQNIGHVSDGTASSLDAAVLLKQLHQENKAFNDTLIKKGYRSLTSQLVGWAEKPVYDPASHSLTWAVETRPAQSKDTLVNYQIRILGRSGMLSMTLTGSLEKLPMFETAAAKILSALQFSPSHRYADFAARTDKVAPYSLSGLITGHMQPASPPRSPLIMAAILKLAGFILLFAVALFAMARSRRRRHVD